jgi:Ni/Fe-hydrogenase subunit HybB-like protein
MSPTTINHTTITKPIGSRSRTIEKPRWQRMVPAFGFRVVNRFFLVLIALAVLGLLLTAYRELVGLGPSTGMNDKFGWGIWKTFNVVVLTALGSGAFSVGISAWVFRRRLLFPLMRMALLTSMLAYTCGLCLLGIDVGRPWNFYWVLFPWRWNLHSPMAEVAICMSIYATIPLLIENLTPILERLWYVNLRLRPAVEAIEHGLHKGFPFIISLAYLLPAMHQSSLGALMLLAGPRVHPLWQTPTLPLLYLGAAAFMSFGCVAGTTMLCCVAWRRAMDMEVLNEAARICAWMIFGFLAVRFVDLFFRGSLVTAFRLDRYAGIFWLETLLIGYGGWLLRRSLKDHQWKTMWLGYLISAFGGMLYRFTPTTLAYMPGPKATYFPSMMELLIGLGFDALGIAAFLLIVKVCAILPATLQEWRDMSSYFTVHEPYVLWEQYLNFGFFDYKLLDSDLSRPYVKTNHD